MAITYRLSSLSFFLSFHQIGLVSAGIVGASNTKDRSYYQEKFFDWMIQHPVEIDSSEVFVKMLQNFANNDDIISKHNAGNHTFTLGHNKFSHLSVSEWRSYLKLDIKRQKTMFHSSGKFHLPSGQLQIASAIDWVAMGAVSSVKDQGSCGSCWAYSAAGALEAAYKLKYSTIYEPLIGVSAQWFIDCDTSNNGCDGGLMDSAFAFAEDASHGGLCSDTDYPYSTGSDVCKKRTTIPNSSPEGFYDVTPMSDEALATALNIQPISVGVDASSSAFQLYHYGVFDNKACGEEVNHAMLVVGYATDPSFGEHYWNVKNSWGTDWGENGYIRLTRNTNKSQKSGTCGVLTMPSAPTY